MSDISLTTVEAQPYLFTEHSTGMNPDDISEAIGSGLRQVYAHMQGNGVPPAGSALVLYTRMENGQMDFHVGFEISPEDLDKGHDPIKAGNTPEGKVLTALHAGPYDTLRNTYGAMTQHIEAEGLQWGGPCWEIYLNDPSSTAPENLRTQVYIQVE